MKTFENAKIGDKVYDIRFGEGTINSISASVNFPIRVEFKYNTYNYVAYTINGKYTLNDANPTLFWSKPEIIAPPAPKRMVTKTISKWVNIYNDGTEYVHQSKKSAKNAASSNACIATVELIGTYEVEE